MSPRLSKSRFQTGLQCPKALWLSTHERELADPVSESQQHIFDTGTAVGELARRRFPGGVLVTASHLESALALRVTKGLVEDPPPAIYEAAFEHGGVLVRADVLVHVSDNVWDLYEVKSSTKLKPENITDAAVQSWVIEGAGLQLRRIHLMHLDNTYVYAGGKYDLSRLFIAEDVTDEARAYAAQVPARVAEMLSMLSGPMPDIPVGSQCTNPYPCAFSGYCSASQSAQTGDAGDGTGDPVIVGDPKRSLIGVVHPIHFLDFETMMSALPLYSGTRPWQQVPFQWSDHVLHDNGDLEHRDFLYEGTDDPRLAFLESLLDALGDSGSVVVYSPFENSRLRELSAAFPQHAEAISAVQARLFDLLGAVRVHVRYPQGIRGSLSIKSVLPLFVSDLSYDGLAIAEGGTASLRYLQCATNRITGPERTRVYRDLRTYCGVDTMAMVRLFDELQKV